MYFKFQCISPVFFEKYVVVKNRNIICILYHTFHDCYVISSTKLTCNMHVIYSCLFLENDALFSTSFFLLLVLHIAGRTRKRIIVLLMTFSNSVFFSFLFSFLILLNSERNLE
jgi:hypothetical protein